MFPFETALELDRLALELLERDVRHLSDEVLTLPTPCDGWNVRDLISHMNVEHVAICGGLIDEGKDPRAEFSGIARRWIEFFQSKTRATVRVPKWDWPCPQRWCFLSTSQTWLCTGGISLPRSAHPALSLRSFSTRRQRSRPW